MPCIAVCMLANIVQGWTWSIVGFLTDIDMLADIFGHIGECIDCM